MNHRVMKLITLTALVAGAAARAYADPSNPWSVSVIGGDSITESGDLRALTSTRSAPRSPRLTLAPTAT
jgi:hypothetical protein